MTAVQFVPKIEARPGDRIREAGSIAPLEHMPRVARIGEAEGVFVSDGLSERYVPHVQIEMVISTIDV